MGDLGAPLLGGLESSAAQELAALRIALLGSTMGVKGS